MIEKPGEPAGHGLIAVIRRANAVGGQGGGAAFARKIRSMRPGMFPARDFTRHRETP